MQNTVPTVPLWACVDCLFLLANGEISPDAQDPDALLSRFDGVNVTPGMFAEYHEEGCDLDGCDCEVRPFSAASCDGCGSPLAGERHAVTAWVHE